MVFIKKSVYIVDVFNGIHPVVFIQLYKYTQVHLTTLFNLFLSQHVSIDTSHHQTCYTNS